MVVEISLVYFSSAKAGYVSEIPVMSDIPVHDVKKGGSKKAETFAITLYNLQRTINLKKGEKKMKKYPPRTGNPQFYQQRKQEKLCYFCGTKGHMIADCRQQKQKEQETGKSSYSTEILLEDGQSFDKFLESLNITY